MKCAICGEETIALFRLNRKGVAGKFACKSCCELAAVPIPAQIADLVEILKEGAKI